VLRARWLLPIDRPPIESGWISAADGRIVEVGEGRPPARTEDLGDVALLPGLVNAHTHLELSWLAGRVAPAGSLVDWIRDLIRQRGSPLPGGDRERTDAMSAAAAAMRDTGTVLVGDISNALTSSPALAEAGLGGVIFHELLGFNVADPAGMVRDAMERLQAIFGVTPGSDPASQGSDPGLTPALAAHAPYSTSPPLISEIARRRGHAPLSIHVAEAPEEVEFLRTGRGPFRDLLDELGAWHPAWQPPQCDPVEYLHRLGYLQRGMLAVHAVQLSDDALRRLGDTGAIVVTCPRSNSYVGAGLPRVSHFYSSGVPVAIGTDSLASAPTLNLFDELAELRRVAPDVAPGAFLDSATRQGARALGLGTGFGTLARGKRAALVAVTIPAGVRDVEEYLVSGVPASSVRRVS
jgi:cytosine/adenosine deaminase-related metal-dependent hydrolase